jgi:hypothetical protein
MQIRLGRFAWWSKSTAMVAIGRPAAALAPFASRLQTGIVIAHTGQNLDGCSGNSQSRLAASSPLAPLFERGADCSDARKGV